MSHETKERWRKVNELLHKALELEPEERTSYVMRSITTDTDLRQEVLAHLKNIREYSERTTFRLAPEGESLETIYGQRMLGSSLGPWRLVELLGQGGMGYVFLAERNDREFDQMAAIKVIRPDMATDELLTRFRNERQILADLKHPNIARLLDGGTTEEGMPYFAMEYVKGRTLDAYCDELRLGVEARIELFIQVCQAVQYAHKNLVVHRDIKPNNILVTEEGVPKLLDFGIAKLLGDAVRGTELETSADAKPMTPAYASPEQMRCEPITTASDVYTLGVLLYELLTGYSPRLVENLGQDKTSNYGPLKPSRVVLRTYSWSATGPEVNAANRASIPDRLSRTLRGDLDCIVQRAMREEPQSRYSSAGQMAEDLQRHLQNLPVLARKQTFLYTANRFARRHLLAVAVSVFGLAAIIGFGVKTEMQRRLLEDQQAILTQQKRQLQVNQELLLVERDAAQNQRDMSERLLAFLEGVFQLADPAIAAQVTPRQMVDVGAEGIEERLADKPLLQARIYHTLAKVYTGLGAYADGRKYLERAIVKLEQLGQSESLEMADAMESMAWLMYFSKMNSEAVSYAEKAREIRAGFGRDRLDYIEIHSNLALLYNEAGLHDLAQGYAEHEDVVRRVLLAERGKAEPDPDRESRLSLCLAYLLRVKRNYREAERYHRAGLEGLAQSIGERHPKYLYNLALLAYLLQTMGSPEDLRRAIEVQEDKLALQKRLLGDGHRSVAQTYYDLAEMDLELGRLEEARSRTDLALGVYGKLTEDTQVPVLLIKGLQARIAAAMARHETAESLFEETITGLRAQETDVARELAINVEWYALYLEARQLPARAEAYHREAYQILSATHHGDSDWPAVTLSRWGDCLRRLHRFEEAEPKLVESLATLSARLGPKDRATLEAARHLADFYRQTDRSEDLRTLERQYPELQAAKAAEDR
ncbi:Non-specific serine/threonine protein kinase [Sulfidibacter corallicola]|uniref:Serine/threonine protein kinase n=1 Tax=Sulfidibacter corallicola TaxID=2818388 RepID=A0A8A4TNT8_SULCO|nr:serine/threonine-protein kinase [Sulfidibacter corallicola]QTD51213.1 serine/threonine protein kinase [Sulfidibacter corallicola]